MKTWFYAVHCPKNIDRFVKRSGDIQTLDPGNLDYSFETPKALEKDVAKKETESALVTLYTSYTRDQLAAALEKFPKQNILLGSNVSTDQIEAELSGGTMSPSTEQSLNMRRSVDKTNPVPPTFSEIGKYLESILGGNNTLNTVIAQTNLQINKRWPGQTVFTPGNIG